ncbi:MAG TPA: cation transporter [Afifellaceae bacterium]|nr:cation transporter [Afifellaceae bacterium]
MKRILMYAALATVMLASPVTLAGEQTVKLSVPGMTCASCPVIVKMSISALEGVTAVDTVLDDRTATVTFDDAITSVEAIRQATAGIGYKTSVIEQTSGS